MWLLSMVRQCPKLTSWWYQEVTTTTIRHITTPIIIWAELMYTLSSFTWICYPVIHKVLYLFTTKGLAKYTKLVYNTRRWKHGQNKHLIFYYSEHSLYLSYKRTHCTGENIPDTSKWTWYMYTKDMPTRKWAWEIQPNQPDKENKAKMRKISTTIKNDNHIKKGFIISSQRVVYINFPQKWKGSFAAKRTLRCS